MIYNNISELIGNTPILKLPDNYAGIKNIEIYAKLEHMNPFGSLKDRIAKNMFDEIKDDVKASGKTIIEASSGNTGKALSILCSTNQIPFKAITNRIKIPEMRMAMQCTGCEIEELPGLSDCPDLNDPNSYTTFADNLAKGEPEKYHYTDQYFNEKNWQAHYKSGQEVIGDLGEVDYFFSMLGTTGSSFGMGKAFREKNENTEIYGVVAKSGEHIPGARNSNELWEVGFYDRDFYTDILLETGKGATDGSIKLIQDLGLLAGPTAGGTFTSALKKLKELDKKLDGTKEKKKAVFLVCDRVELYFNYLNGVSPEIFSESTSSRKKVSDMKSETDKEFILSSDFVEKNKDDFIMIDIRGNFPYSIGHIEGSLNIIDEHLTSMVEEGKVFPKKKKLLIICRIGKNSAQYVNFLREQGYEAFMLASGLSGWKKDGLNLIKD
ncbi:pyridoxal-phosphate dependent enzyme [Candidatus Gracilibacteria bacterium]|nr:pyridoxal-phosphate dependent enzyme [Candidatus Gracilibacteria bacterium]